MRRSPERVIPTDMIPKRYERNIVAITAECGSWPSVGYPEPTQVIPYLINRCSLSKSTVFSIGRASTVCPLPVIVVALNIEL
jgi:hypothetical protein